MSKKRVESEGKKGGGGVPAIQRPFAQVLPGIRITKEKRTRTKDIEGDRAKARREVARERTKKTTRRGGKKEKKSEEKRAICDFHPSFSRKRHSIGKLKWKGSSQVALYLRGKKKRAKRMKKGSEMGNKKKHAPPVQEGTSVA